MNHRVRNLFTLAHSVVALSARSVDTSKELASVVGDRLDALARAHSLTLPKRADQPSQREQATTLHDLIRAIVLPYENTEGRPRRIVVSGPDISVSAALVTDFALLLHEIATNAAKYGALSTPRGHVDISCTAENGVFSLIWTERGGPRIDEKPTAKALAASWPALPSSVGSAANFGATGILMVLLFIYRFLGNVLGAEYPSEPRHLLTSQFSMSPIWIT